MDYSTCYCPNEHCLFYGIPFDDSGLVWNGSSRGYRQLLCRHCRTAVSLRRGTAYARVEVDARIFTIVMRALAEGNSLRGTGRIIGVDKDTVCAWLDRAGQHCQKVTTYLFDQLHITECQLDELWSFVRKKETHLTPAEKVLALYGDAWVWIAFAVSWRLVTAFVVGKRCQENADLLIERLQVVSCGFIPFFISDQLPAYPQALLNGYGIPELLIDIPGKRGRKPKPKLLPPSNLHYAQIVKHRRNGRVAEVTTRIICGDEAAIQGRLQASPASQTINTSYVERNNLTCRQCNGRLSRKVLRFSKDLTWMEKHLWLTFAYYHFVLPHASLTQPLPYPQPTRGTGSPKKWQSVTPAMAAGITDHAWTMEELLSYRVPPQFLAQWQAEETRNRETKIHHGH